MIKTGIIGCGKIAMVRHAPEYAAHPHCELTGCYSRHRECAEALSAAFGCRLYDSEAALLADVDAVSICTANNTHAALAVQALDAGVHVLCEKPMATALADCAAMVDAADRSGKNLMIAQNQRFTATHEKARSLIAAGEIGRVLTFRATFGHPGPEHWTGRGDTWFFDREQAAFGAIADLGVHKTDLLFYLLGEPIVEVTALTATLDKKWPDGTAVDVDDNALCLYRTKSGALGSMHVSWTFYGGEDNSTIVYGSEGVLRCYDDPVYSLIVEKRDGSSSYYKLDRILTNEEQEAGPVPSTGVIDEFIASIREHRPPSIDGREALSVMQVVFAAQQSAQEQRTVTVK